VDYSPKVEMILNKGPNSRQLQSEKRERERERKKANQRMAQELKPLKDL